MQTCKKCGIKGKFIVLSERGYCKDCESDLQYLNKLNDESIINTSEDHFKEVIKDGILMLIPAIIIIILIYSLF